MMTTSFKFSLDADYIIFVEKYSSRSAARDDICSNIQTVHTDLQSIWGCKISSLTLTVEFHLNGTEESLNRTLMSLKALTKSEAEIPTSHGSLRALSRTLYQDGIYKGSEEVKLFFLFKLS